MPLFSGLAVDDLTNGVAHLIQTALTPVFLLTGIGNLLGLFNTRLARVSDHIAQTADLLTKDVSLAEKAMLQHHLVLLARRLWLLDTSIALGAVGGASTCGAAFVLFLGSVRNSGVAGWLIGLFALALGCTVSSLIVFLGDSLAAWHGFRRVGPLPRSIKDNANGT
jgi:hypothetical protein